MTEEDFKKAAENFLMLQNNNDHNFKILQYQIDKLQAQIDDLNELRKLFHLPPPENKDRPYFDIKDAEKVKWLWITSTSVLSWHMWIHLFH